MTNPKHDEELEAALLTHWESVPKYEVGSAESWHHKYFKAGAAFERERILALLRGDTYDYDNKSWVDVTRAPNASEWADYIEEFPIMSLKERFPYYWICSSCAKEKGGVWPKGHVATAADIKCEYCQDKNRLPGEASVPWVDYNWPGIKTSHLRD